MSIDLVELAEVSDEYRAAISDQAEELGMSNFADAVLDPALGPEKLMDAAVKDVRAMTDADEDDAREVLLWGVLFGSAMRVIESVGEQAMTPDMGEDFN